MLVSGALGLSVAKVVNLGHFGKWCVCVVWWLCIGLWWRVGISGAKRAELWS